MSRAGIRDDVEQAVASYHTEQAWLREHGMSEEAYVARYGSKDDPHHYGDGGEAIYAADLAALDKAEARAIEAIIAAG